MDLIYGAQYPDGCFDFVAEEPLCRAREILSVSSMLKSHLIEIAPDDRSADKKQSCWEVFSCSNVLCPAHGKSSMECWLYSRKLNCANLIEENFSKNCHLVLTCSYFKNKGEHHPKGWKVVFFRNSYTNTTERRWSAFIKRREFCRDTKSNTGWSVYHRP